MTLCTTGRTVILLIVALLFLCDRAGAYSVLSHEEVVDMAWKLNIVPMLRARFPGITPDQIREAHAYAYGGSVIQDIGYYPFGSHYFSDLLHYVRPNVFVENLIRDSTTPDGYAFALGALAHFCGDTIGHPAVNVVDAQENPKLREKYGDVVTYAENPTAHLRTEFGFDVVEVAQGHYTQDDYRDFIGFRVAKPLLEKAFLETYGVPMGDIIKHEDLAISTYRHAVSFIIPKMTEVAFVSYKDQIQKAAPGREKRKFIYRLNRTEYQKSFGSDYTRLGFGARVLAFFLRLMPKVGPFKSLKVSIPDPQEQDVYLKSMNGTVDAYRLYLAEITAGPAPLPPEDPKDAADAATAAAKLQKDAVKATHAAAKAAPENKEKQQATAQHVQAVADKMKASARDEKGQVAAAAKGNVIQVPGALPAGSPIPAPSVPALADLDLDTGRPSAAGEYKLADEAYAHLLADLVRPAAVSTTTAQGEPTVARLDPALVAAIQQFFANRIPRTGPPPSKSEAAREAELAIQVKANLATLRTLTAGSATGAP